MQLMREQNPQKGLSCMSC